MKLKLALIILFIIIGVGGEPTKPSGIFCRRIDNVFYCCRDSPEGMNCFMSIDR